MDEATLYVAGKRQMARVASRLDDEQLRVTCPSCPAWSNQDVIAHHIHFLGAMIDDDVPSE
ncbi:MAG: maleylpyruvate isomerase N-terminal domain-containing protein, partial [Ilumatobacter sp.]